MKLYPIHTGTLKVDVSPAGSEKQSSSSWRLPVDIVKHLCGVVSASFCQDGKEYADQLAANGNYRLFLLEWIDFACRVILVDLAELFIPGQQRDYCVENQHPETGAATFAYRRPAFMLSRTVFPEG